MRLADYFEGGGVVWPRAEFCGYNKNCLKPAKVRDRHKMTQNGASRARAIAALLEERNVTAAARAAAIGRRTLQRWLADPSFCADLKRASGDCLDVTKARLQAASGQALDALVELTAADLDPSIRCRAAGKILDLALGSAKVAGLDEEPQVVTADLRGELARKLAKLAGRGALASVPKPAAAMPAAAQPRAPSGLFLQGETTGDGIEW